MMASISEALALALKYHQAGQLPQAEQLYRRILQADPYQVEALHLLGVLAYQVGRDDVAAESIGQALRLRPDFAVAHDHLGLVLRRQGRLDEALAHHREAVRLQPGLVTAHCNLALALQEQGRLDEAAASLERAVALGSAPPDVYVTACVALGNVYQRMGREDAAVASYRQALSVRPDNVKAYNDLGYALQRQGKFAEAAACYRHALRLDPGYALAHVNLAFLLTQEGRPDEAEAPCREALRLGPDLPEAHSTLAVVLLGQGRVEEALAACEHALRLRPNYGDAHNNRGNVLRALGRLPEAEASFRQALDCDPRSALAWTNLGNVRKALGHFDEALTHYERALALRPGHAEAHQDLAVARAEQGHMDEAEAHFREALRLRPDELSRVQLATLLPPVYQSLEDMQAWRRRLLDNLGALHRDGVRVDVTRQCVPSLFYLAYQGGNDRDVQRDLARLYSAPAGGTAGTGPAARQRAAGLTPTLFGTVPAGGKTRVGFLSRLLRGHTIGRLMRGMIAHLSRQAFEVVVLTVGAADDPIGCFLRDHADAYVVLPDDPQAARRLVAEQRLDVLFYTDVGMEPLTDTLAHSRLAPVQCVTWGHPSTTGIPVMDYFISQEDLDAEGAEAHYTETLVRLKTLPIYYYRPAPPAAPKGRADFGLPESGHLYVCPQSLFKFHPDFDDVLGRILRADPDGHVVLLRGSRPEWEELLMRRLGRTLADVLERVRFVPRQDLPGFLSLNAVADVMLDPVHFGGGNTSYEALALGVPIVTLPSAFLRGRITYALYRQMGVLDCVAASADEYVGLAVRLGTDPAYRAGVRAKILAASAVLYENAAGVRELEEFLLRAVAAARAGGKALLTAPRPLK
jgi:predicted O-linked N-acetylglucosamine transferase (SPINDLY family)